MSKLLSRFDVPPCLRLANGIGKEDNNHLHSIFNLNHPVELPVPQINHTLLPGVSPFCSISKYYRSCLQRIRNAVHKQGYTR